MITLLFLINTAAFAAPLDFRPATEACLTPAQVEDRVYYCSQNTIATKAASNCHDAIKALWDKAPEGLSISFRELYRANDGRQQVNYHDTHRDHERALAELDRLIKFTQAKTTLVAHYPKVMVNFPGSAEDPSLSAPCYDDRVAQIQEWVGKLDDMILQGKAAFDESNRLRGIAQMRDDHGTNMEDAMDVLTNMRHFEHHEAPVIPAGLSRAPASDITGTQQELEKEALASFKLRDQLTGP
jgi:hypothetical protein